MTILPNPRQLRYLVALAESRDFGRATPAALEAVGETANTARAPMSGPLRPGLIPTIGPFPRPKLMPVLRAAFPSPRLFPREDTTARLVDRLNANRLDVLPLALPCDCGGAGVPPVVRDEFLVALPQDHRLARQAVIPVAALAAERLLLLEEGHCLRAQALAVRGLLAGEKGETQDGYAATSLHTLVQMVAGGPGVTLPPRLSVAAGVTDGTGLVTRPLAAAGAWRTLGLAWRPNAPRAADYRALAPHLAEACRTQVGPAA